MAREKRPPMKIEELEEKSRAERGTLTYVESNRGSPEGAISEKTMNESPRPSKFRVGRHFKIAGLPQVLVSCILSALIAILIVYQMAPGREEFQVAWSAFEEAQASQHGRLSSLEGDVYDETVRLEAVIAGMGEFPKRAELERLEAKVAEVLELEARLSELEVGTSELEARLEVGMSELEASVAGELSARLLELEARVTEALELEVNITEELSARLLELEAKVDELKNPWEVDKWEKLLLE